MDTLAHYRLLEQIGAGGLGDVFRARDTKVGRTVAIKIVPDAIAGDPDARARLVADARLAASVSHPNVATLFEVGEDQGHLFLAIEFVPGEPLRQVIGGRPLHPRRAVEIAVQIADALAEAHAAGVRHLDLSPDTIVLTPKGTAKLLDLGLSAWTSGGRARTAAAVRLASEGQTELTTASYLSPEQALGGTVDDRSDLFSLGAVLFEMLTGRPAFAGATPTDQALGVMQAPAPPPGRLNPGVPAELDPIVERALAKTPDARYASAAAMAADLRSVAAVLDIRSGDSAPPSLVPAVAQRSWWPVVLALLVILALAAGLWWWLSG